MGASRKHNMASVTAKKNLIEKIEAQSFKSAEDHRILNTHYSKLAARLRKESTQPETGDAWDAFGEDVVTDTEKYAQFQEAAKLAEKHRRASTQKASAVRSDRREAYGVGF